jgi:DNA topoisomerase-1
MANQRSPSANLVIVESPAKCQKIQEFLGAGWRVIASMGHIRALEETLDAIGLDRDFEAKYQFLKDKGKAIKQLKDAAAEATTVYLASDDDREGEAIAYSVCLLLKLNPKTTLRAVFHEITKKAVLSAINAPRHLDMNRVNAQQSRAILDMMIGFTISPLLWRYVAPSLSAGRCQTPALRLVVEREDQIVNFKASSSWSLSADWTTPTPTAFKFNSHLSDELEDEESAVNYMEIIHQTPDGTIISNDTKLWTHSAPDPLITSTLQQQVSAQFSINPKNTMKIAQRLYEAGHITYMRTDKAVISEEAKAEAKQWVLENYGEEFVAEKQEQKEEKEEVSTAKTAKTTKKKPKVATEPTQESGEVKAQEAHEAIRPTHMEVTALPEDATWTPYDRKVYKLIWQRAIQSVMAAARGETCKVRTQIVDDQDFTWVSQWKHTTFEGWQKAGKVVQIDDDDHCDQETTAEDLKEEVWVKALNLKPGDKVQWRNMKAEPKETKAQGRYTEAMLVRELEKFGIGRPSTFASLIATTLDKAYVETKNIPAVAISVKEYSLKPNQWPPAAEDLKKKVGAEKNKLVPTELGRSVMNFALKHFNDLFDYGFTSQMEKQLDRIAEGKEDSKQVLRTVWASYKDRYEDLISKQHIKTKDGEPNARLKEFSNNLKAVQSKKGPLLLIEGAKKEDTQFLGWPEGVAFEDMTEELAIKFKDEVAKKKIGINAGEWNGHPIVKKTGKFGEYLQSDNVSIPYQQDEEPDKTIARFEAKKNGNLKQFKDYVIRTGQYGPYIMKTSLKKPQFVSLSAGVDVTKLTEKDVEALYKAGLESKKKWKGAGRTAT